MNRLEKPCRVRTVPGSWYSPSSDPPYCAPLHLVVPKHSVWEMHTRVLGHRPGRHIRRLYATRSVACWKGTPQPSLTPVFPSLSEPARSTKLILEVIYFSSDKVREWAYKNIQTEFIQNAAGGVSGWAASSHQSQQSPVPAVTRPSSHPSLQSPILMLNKERAPTSM